MADQLDDPGIRDVSTPPCFPSFGEKGSNLHRLVQSQEAYRLADPRECPVGIEPMWLVWKTSAFAARPRAHAEGEGVEPSRLIARPGSGRMPSPIGLPFRGSLASGKSILTVGPARIHVTDKDTSTGCQCLPLALLNAHRIDRDEKR